MDEEKEKYKCRICDRELELIPEEQENDHPYIPLYFCDHCNKHYRFIEVD